MKLIIEPSTKDNLYLDNVDGLILSLKDYSIGSNIYFDIDEIKEIVNNTSKEIFINMNNNIMNNEIEELKELLIELDKIKVSGIFFYDIAILELKRELNLNVDLIWSQTHMVNNYRTCDYYYSKGVKYALLGKEITLEEIIEIINKSKITSMVEVVSIPNIAFSKRLLLTNFYKDLNKKTNYELEIEEKTTHEKYLVKEEKKGTSFYQNKLINGTSVIKELYDNNCEYIIMREKSIPDFKELIIDTKEYIDNKCKDKNYVEKYKKLGDNTNFFFKKTIYKVKKK